MSHITPQVFNFLQDIKEYGTKEWFEENKKTYEAAKGDMIAFAEEVLFLMNQHDQISTPSGKKSLYRIFRDVRFSKDKTPYKHHWAGGLARATAYKRGGFFYSIEPGNTFVAGGFFAPNADDLLLIRKQIDVDASPLRNVINSSEFKNHFGTLNGSQLKTAPKGFPKEHEDIDLLRYKSYTVRHDFTDEQVLAPDFAKELTKVLSQMLPFFDVMTEYLTTDLNGISLLDK